MFLQRTCLELKKAQLLPPHARAISLIKGIGVKKGWPVTLTHEIGEILGLPKPCILSGKVMHWRPCTAADVMDFLPSEADGSVPLLLFIGANVAGDVASEHFAEATIGHAEGEAETAALWQLLFDRPSFKVNVLPDVDGVEVRASITLHNTYYHCYHMSMVGYLISAGRSCLLDMMNLLSPSDPSKVRCTLRQVCGALKNVVAVAGGICEGMGQGTNTKAAILRLGVEEMKTFIMLFFGGLLAVSYAGIEPLRCP